MAARKKATKRRSRAKPAGVSERLYAELMIGDPRVPIRDTFMSYLKENDSKSEMDVAGALANAIVSRKDSTAFLQRCKGDPAFAICELYRAGIKIGFAQGERVRPPTPKAPPQTVVDLHAMIRNEARAVVDRMLRNIDEACEDRFD